MSMRKTLLFVMIVLFLSTVACGVAANVPLITAMPTLVVVQPTNTLYPTQVPPTPYPTQIPPTLVPTQAPIPTLAPTPVPTQAPAPVIAPVSDVSGLLSDNDFVRSPDLDHFCLSSCKAYSNVLANMVVSIYANGSVGMGIRVYNGQDSTYTAQVFATVITEMYSMATTKWTITALTSLAGNEIAGQRSTVIDGQSVTMQTSVGVGYFDVVVSFIPVGGGGTGTSS